MPSKTTHSTNERQASSCSDNNEPLRIAIIGAGLTGLMTASILEEKAQQVGQNIEITVFEKSAGVGRLATRYKQASDFQTTEKTEAASQKQWQFDFGAQFFTAKSASFQSYLQPWIERGVVEPWLAKVAQAASKGQSNNDYDITQVERWTTHQPRYIASPKMTSFGRELAKTLTQTTLKYKTRVAPLTQSVTEQENKRTTLTDEQGNALGKFDWVICTAPQAQAIELLTNTDFEHLPAIKQPQMLACYTLMLGWYEQQSLPKTLKTLEWDILEVKNNDHSIVSRIFLEHHKPSREQLLSSVTIHASNTWAQAHVDEDIESIKRQMLKATQALLGWDETRDPNYIDCHRWRYAATQQPSVSEQIAYVDNKRQWVVTGDWCGEGRIESCFKAANKAVDIIAF